MVKDCNSKPGLEIEYRAKLSQKVNSLLCDHFEILAGAFPINLGEPQSLKKSR